MLKRERINTIERYLNQHQFATYQELEDICGTSKATIRRDLLELEASGKISMVWGGASIPNSAVMNELTYMRKQQQNETEKAKIASAACKFIHDGASIILDSGTTTRKIVPLLSNFKNLHIITTDIAIASDLSLITNSIVTVIGGTLRHGYYNLSGYHAEELAKSFRADIAFISCDSISYDAKCCMITNIDEIGIKRTLLQIAKKSVLLCDHSKFGREASVSVYPLEKVEHIITGKDIEQQVNKMLEAYRNRFIFV